MGLRAGMGERRKHEQRQPPAPVNAGGPRVDESSGRRDKSAMSLPDRDAAQQLLESHVQDAYQRHHATMVATAMAGYARHFGEDEELWYLTGLLHDLDFEQHPDTHPGESLRWFADWGYPDDLIHAVEAHAYGYHGYATLPRTRLAAALLACDEICGIQHLGIPVDEHIGHLIGFLAALE